MWKYKIYVGIAGAVILLTGLFFSRALISIGIALVFLHGLINHTPAAIWQQLWANKVALLLLLLFGINILSGINTQTPGAFADDVLMKLPFLLLPIGLVSFYNYKQQYLHLLLWVLIACAAATALASLAEYVWFNEEISERLSLGLPAELPTNISHIYFGTMAAFSVIAGFWLALRLQLNIPQKLLLSTALLIVLIYMHLLGSRTGIATLYGSAILGGFVYLNKSGTRWRAVTITSAIIGALLLAALFVPALNTKMLLTRADLQTFFTDGDINDWSLSKRLAAWAAAWQLFLQNPVLGVGMGDIRHELWQTLPQLFPQLEQEHYVSPHNQFLTYLAGLGLIGGGFFLYFFFYPIAFKRNRKNLLFLFFWLVMLISFQVEELIERQIGVGFFAFFWIYLSGFSPSTSKKSSQNIADEIN